MSSPIKRLQVRIGDRIRFVDVRRICFLSAADKYVEVHTEEETHLISKSKNNSGARPFFLPGFPRCQALFWPIFFLPLFNNLANKQLNFDLFANGFGILGLIGIVLFVSLLAGSYPAAWLARFKPVDVFKGKSRGDGHNALTRSLVIFQFGLSIFLIVCAIFMGAQQNFMMTRSLGYNPEHVLGLRSFAGSPEESVERLERLRTELARMPEVLQVSGASSSFNRGWSINGFEHKGEQRSESLAAGSAEHAVQFCFCG